MGDIPLGVRGRAYSEAPTFLALMLRKRDGPTQLLPSYFDISTNPFNEGRAEDIYARVHHFD